MKIISSLDNKLIKSTIALKETRERKKTGLFLVDGAREIELAIKAGLRPEILFFCPEIATRQIKTEAETIEVSTNVFSKMAYKENPDGFLAVFKKQDFFLRDLKKDKKSSYLLIILEGIEKPGNLGAIIRTANAAGVDGIILNDSLIDIYNPNVIKASEGLIFSTKIIMSNREETIDFLKENKIKSFGAATSGKKNYDENNFKLSIALVLGSEAQGLSKNWLKEADQLIKIPMRAGVDSLNLSVSAAILTYEVLRQRGFNSLK